MSAAKRKGTQWEVDVRNFLRRNGFPQCERLPTEGAHDRGDLAGVPISISCKAYSDYGGHVGEWVDAARRMAITARKWRWAVVFKRRMRPVEDAFVVISLAALAELMRRISDADQALNELLREETIIDENAKAAAS